MFCLINSIATFMDCNHCDDRTEDDDILHIYVKYILEKKKSSCKLSKFSCIRLRRIQGFHNLLTYV